MCQVPKIDFADLLELIVRTGALDVDYLRPKKQPPAEPRHHLVLTFQPDCTVCKKVSK